ncbi:phage tail tip lysozyme [Nocardiopsis prasina]|uniref:phage tail tip lysozyme n=1 Tax=Nocardiopsis prasina TaxID=2015 RepID=UPI00034B6EF9|nr:phage tail tip lysozyme [Nocardiopsis prasina]
MSGIGGGAGGLQPPGPGDSGEIGKAAQKGVPGLGDAAKGGPGEGSEKGAESGAGPEKASEGAPSGPGGPGGGPPGLGAGGTSKAAKDGAEGTKGVAKGVGAAAAIPAIGLGAQLLVIMMFLKWLKGLMSALAAMLLNLLNLLWSIVVAVAKTVVGAVLAVGAAVAAAVGGAISVVTGAAMSVGAGFLAIVAIVATAVQATNENNATAQRDAMPEDCRPETEATVNEIDAKAAAQLNDESMEDMAEKVYSILGGMGMQDENIAGVLGNFQQESMIDPTTVETIYTEPYEYGPRTEAAEKNGFKVELIDADYAARYPAIDLVGIGLGQWTNGRNTMLTDYAEETGGEWWELETQFAFMLSEDDPARVNFAKELIESPDGSIEESTQEWMVKWEGLTLGVEENRAKLATRLDHADVWFAKLDSWKADKSLADSVLEQAETTLSAANQNRRAAVVQDCQTANVSGGGVVQAGEMIPCASLGTMDSQACDLHEHLQDEFGGFFISAGGYRDEATSNHGEGKAIDYMMAELGEVPTEEMKNSGTEVVNYLVANHEELNILGILWYERVWNPLRDPVGKWSNEITRDAERGDITQSHIDHIHVSVGKPGTFK